MLDDFELAYASGENSEEIKLKSIVGGSLIVHILGVGEDSVTAEVIQHAESELPTQVALVMKNHLPEVSYLGVVSREEAEQRLADISNASQNTISIVE